MQIKQHVFIEGIECKECARCKRNLPISTDFNTLKRNWDKLNNYCKDCHKKEMKDYNLKNKDKKIAYMTKNKQHFKEKGSIYYQKNKDKLAECSRIYNEKNRQKIKKYNHERYIKDKKRIKLVVLKYRRENRDRFNVLQQIRRTSKRESIYNLKSDDWIKCKHYFNNKCAYCGKEEKLTQDHFVAFNNGGEYSINNIVPICLSCNSGKQDSDFFEWYPRQTFYNKKREQKVLKYLNYDLKTKYQQLALI